jgi:hypothetical protein
MSLQTNQLNQAHVYCALVSLRNTKKKTSSMVLLTLPPYDSQFSILSKSI